MMDIILSKPLVYCYLVFVGVLLITALWPRETGLAVGEPRAAAPTPVPSSATHRWQHVAISSGPPCGAPPCSPGATDRLFSDLQATLYASYAVRLELAIRTIRGDPPVGASQRIERPGDLPS
jgi:hypothetical protein